MIGQNDSRLKKNANKGEDGTKKAEKGPEIVREIPQVSSALFFQYNTALVPPYRMSLMPYTFRFWEVFILIQTDVLIDTNFLSHTVQRKLPLLETLMDCLYAKCIPVITSCGSYTPHHSLTYEYRLTVPQLWQNSKS